MCTQRDSRIQGEVCEVEGMDSGVSYGHFFAAHDGSTRLEVS
jgi:hypothetical protein